MVVRITRRLSQFVHSRHRTGVRIHHAADCRGVLREVVMIRGMHAMFYSSEAEALRTFIRDKLGFPATDVGDGWLIFDAPEADLGVHPTEGGNPPSGTADISFYCDDIEQTVAELARRGVEFTQDVEDQGYGLVTYFRVPGAFRIQLYQPRYTK
jgi:catechol 2,3-dioxygenase-like lactoylglutathione lyase family enzyme